MRIEKPTIGEPLPVKFYIKNESPQTLQIRSAMTIVIREIRKGDNLDLIADEFWEGLNKMKPDLDVAMVPETLLWPDAKPPIVTPVDQQLITMKSAAIFAMGKFSYRDPNGKRLTKEVCTWAIGAESDHYTYCARHNN